MVVIGCGAFVIHIVGGAVNDVDVVGYNFVGISVNL